MEKRWGSTQGTYVTSATEGAAAAQNVRLPIVRAVRIIISPTPLLFCVWKEEKTGAKGGCRGGLDVDECRSVGQRKVA